VRRRIYLMRHGAVSYFDHGRPLKPEDVPLTVAGRDQAYAAASMLRGIEFDRVITSGLPRTIETARIVAPDFEPEAWPDLRELEASNTVLLGEEQAADLARRIRAGEPPEGALQLLKEHVAEKLRVSNPAYLEKYE